MRLGDVASILREALVGNPDLEVSGFSIDSRRVREGDLFFALRGTNHDGHDFVEDALKKGAIGSVVERTPRKPVGNFIKVDSSLEALRRLALYKREAFKGEVVGVAGSVGKTTTKELIYHLLSYTGRAYRSEGNLNSQIGLPLVIANMPLEVAYAVFELGASAVGDVAKLRELARPRIRVLTAIGEEHLESFGSLENVIRGNGELFSDFSEEDRAVLPHYALRFYTLPRELVTTFGEEGDLRVDRVNLSLKGVSFSFWKESFSVPVLSRGIVDNVLASFGVLTTLGYDPRDFKDALKSFRPPEGRMNLLDMDSFWIVDDTYNANPPSVKNALRTLSHLKGGNLRIVVLGDMLELGDRSAELHAQIGREVAKLGIDFAVFYGSMMKHAYDECKKLGGRCVYVDKKEDIKDEILKYMGDKNIILVKGSRGMKMEQLIKELGELVKNEQ
jgi:UDP-N-acetylmuramoyl-tripeptide--D-alanyl-D-alanine ligase